MNESAPSPASADSTRVIAILALVFGILSIFFLGLLFGPAAIVLGAIGGRRGSNLGWWGFGLGIFGLAWTMLAITACLAMTAASL